MNVYLYLMIGSIVALVGVLFFFNYIQSRGKTEEVEEMEETEDVQEEVKEKKNIVRSDEYLTKEDFARFSHNMRVLMEDTVKYFGNSVNTLYSSNQPANNKTADMKDTGNYTLLFKNISTTLTKISGDLEKLNSRLSRIEDKNESIDHQLLVLKIARLKTTVPKGITGKQMAERISNKIGLTPDEVADVLAEIKTKYTV